jgi:uncharacterized protein YceK
MIRLLLSVFVSTILVSGCASVGRGSVSQPLSEGQALADLVLETERDHPERLEAADAEIEALVAALMGPVASDEEPASTMFYAPLSLSASQLDGARSMLNAVHLASYRSRDNAVSGWRDLQSSHSALSGLSARLGTAELGERGTYLRLKAGPLDSPSQAESICETLRIQGLWCTATDFTGEPL